MGELLQRNASIASATDQTTSACASTITITDTGPDIYGTTSNVASGQVVVAAVNGTNYQASVSASGTFVISGISSANASAAAGVPITASTDDGAGCSATAQFVYTACSATVSVASTGPDITGTTTGIPSGRVITIGLNGTNYTDAVAIDGSWSITGVSAADSAAANGSSIQVVIDDGTGCTATTNFTYTSASPCGISTQFLNIPTADAAIGTVDADYMDAITTPIPNFYGDIGAASAGVSTVAGERALQIMLTPATTNGSVGSTKFSTGHNLTPTQEICVSQSIYFPSGFDFGGTATTGTMKVGAGIYGGTVASGGNAQSDGFSVRNTTRNISQGVAEWSIYKYAADQIGTYGDEIRNLDNGSPLLVTTGVWNDITMYVKVNTSTSVADGIIRYYLNGVLAHEITGIQFFSAGTPQVDTIRAEFFYGGSNTDSMKWGPASAQTLAVKDWAYA